MDVLFENNCYPNIINLPVSCLWVSVQEPVPEVNVPCINSILGDKLTVFAPNTTGIRYNTGKHIEIIKQLYDIGKLVDNLTDFEAVKNSFQRIAHAQIAYRELDITYSEVCDDIIETALIIAKETRNTNQADDKIKMKEIQSGITGFQGFLMSGYFRLDEAVAASAKAGYLAAKIKTDDNTPIELFQKQDMSKLIIGNVSYNFLNRLQKINKEAYYYWYKLLVTLGIEQ